jgi:hypothetical protein
MMGPSLTFDKSFLEMISPQEMDELGLNFRIFVTPTLISEIIADLRHPAPRDGKLPEKIVMALARKMAGGHGIQQMHFRPLGMANINQQEVPMFGQVIVDGKAPNVLKTADQRGVVYDSLPDLEMWERWAVGDFSEPDKSRAAKWRSQIELIDVPGISSHWKDFCTKYLSRAKSIEDVIDIVETEIVNSRNPVEQQNFLWAIYQFLEAPPEACFMSQTLFDAGLLPHIKSWAPYAASIGKLGMVFSACLNLRLISSRPTNVIDLQYLFYAPFGMVFVSQDKVHRQLWPAATTNGSFVWGSDMKADLKLYIAAREHNAALPADERTSYWAKFTPESSVISRVRRKYMRFDPRDVPSPKGKTVADLEPFIQEHLRQADEAIDKARREGRY